MSLITDMDKMNIKREWYVVIPYDARIEYRTDFHKPLNELLGTHKNNTFNENKGMYAFFGDDTYALTTYPKMIEMLKDQKNFRRDNNLEVFHMGQIRDHKIRENLENSTKAVDIQVDADNEVSFKLSKVREEVKQHKPQAKNTTNIDVLIANFDIKNPTKKSRSVKKRTHEMA